MRIIIFPIFCLCLAFAYSCKSTKPYSTDFRTGHYKAIFKNSFTDSLEIFFENDGTLTASQYRKEQHFDGRWGWQKGKWERHADTIITKIRAYYLIDLDTAAFRKTYGHEDTAFTVTNTYLVRNNVLKLLNSQSRYGSRDRSRKFRTDFLLVDSTQHSPGNGKSRQ